MDLEEFHENTISDGFSLDLDHQFAPVPDRLGGGIDFGEVPDSAATVIGIHPLPIRVVHGTHFGKNNGHGLRHMLIAHGEEFAKEDYVSVQEFVHDAADFDAIYESDSRPGYWRLVRFADEAMPQHCILVITLHSSNTCYTVVTGYLKQGARRIKGQLLWKRA